VVGHQGQDGRLLVQRLTERGDEIVGIARHECLAPANLLPSACRLDDRDSIFELVRRWQPHEIYYLAAHHGSSEQGPPLDLADDLLASVRVNVAGVVHFLEALRRHAPSTRLFYASTSLIFGSRPVQTPQDESTPTTPEEPYAISKCMGGIAVREYRSRHGVHASIGILYNHESHLRRPSFLSAKIVHAAVAAGRGATEPLLLGDLDARVDWGYAPDFVDAFLRILALDEPSDFIVATGQAHTVREFAATAYGHLGLDWRHFVREEPGILARHRGSRVGNPGRLQRMTGWRPTLDFEAMVRTLVDQARAAANQEPAS
jgi:GDPmannose 4,6-dehydratase